MNRHDNHCHVAKWDGQDTWNVRHTFSEDAVEKLELCGENTKQKKPRKTNRDNISSSAKHNNTILTSLKLLMRRRGRGWERKRGERREDEVRGEIKSRGKPIRHFIYFFNRKLAESVSYFMFPVGVWIRVYDKSRNNVRFNDLIVHSWTSIVFTRERKYWFLHDLSATNYNHRKMVDFISRRLYIHF